MTDEVVRTVAARVPCRVQKAVVDGEAGRERLVLELYVHEGGEGVKRWLVVDGGALALADAKPERAGRDDGDGGEEGKARGPSALQGLVRKECVPSVLAEIGWAEPLARLVFQGAAPRPRVLVVEHTAEPRAVLCADTEEGLRVLGLLGPPRASDGRDLRRGRVYEAPRTPRPFVAHGDGGGEPARAARPRAAGDERAQALAATRAALKAEAKRVKRLVDALTGDLARHGDAARHEEEGELLKTVLARVKRGDPSVDVIDWSGAPRTIPLDPSKDAKANLDERFKRARRARASAARTAPRLEEARARLALVEGARAAVAANDLAGAALDAALEEARAVLASPESGGSARRKAAKATKPGKRLAWRAFKCSGDVVVRVGRGARDNDALVKAARGNDLWLHARNHQGAHVVVPVAGGAAAGADGTGVDRELLLDAAHLAAHFSSARGEARVDVQHTRVKHLKKPGPGAPAGLVHVTHETVLHLRVDDARVQALLSREVPAT